jgi:hypothetical protein
VNTKRVCAEDRRAASSLATTLSSYVITAALAVLGAQAVIVTFVIDKRRGLSSFYAVGGAGTACLVLSIILGGRGIWEIIQAGSGGNWEISPRNQKFNWQAILALAGTLLVVASALLGQPKD